MIHRAQRKPRRERHGNRATSRAQSGLAAPPTHTDQQRDLRLDALCDLALGAAIAAAVFSVAARGLDIPFAGPLTVAGLLLGMVPFFGRAMWLGLVALLCVLDTNGTSAILIVVVVLSATASSERAARGLVRRWSGGPQAHRIRVSLLALGLVVAGPAGVVVGLALSPRRRAARTRWQHRWRVGAPVGPLLLVLAAIPALVFPVQHNARAIPASDPVPGFSAPPIATVLFVHGLGEASGRPGDFAALFDPLRTTFGEGAVHEASYYQDLSDRKQGTRDCGALGPAMRIPNLSLNLHGMPVDLSTLGRDKCDSESDLGLNVLRLARQVRDLHASTGKRVILVGYSMGGAIVRGLLTLSALRHDGIVQKDVDSVVLLHAVTQGSVLARDGGRIAQIPLLGELASNVFAGTIADPSRPAFSELAPQSAYQKWLAAHASQVPALPTFVTYGELTVIGENCILDVYVCVTTGHSAVGDGAVDPGSTNPADLPVAGGARYLPQGRGHQSWEWAERIAVRWDRQLDALSLQLLSRLYHAPNQHFAILSKSDQLVVADCQTGLPIREADELRRLIAGRLSGHPYLCGRPSG